MSKINTDNEPENSHLIEAAEDSFSFPDQSPSNQISQQLENPIPSSEEELDPITKAIREQILAKQRELIAEHLKEDIKDPQKFAEYAKDEENQKKISEALKNVDLKTKLEDVEIKGYADIHKKFSDRFEIMKWTDGSRIGPEKEGISTKSQIVKNPDGKEIARLTESTHQITPPVTVKDGNGQDVKLNSYRTINFPTKLENNDTMHLSLAVKDENGKNIPKNKAVYFTAHYENGKLLEVSSPTPVKFSSNEPDAVGYIEQGGKIYTLPVTRENYQQMMKEVTINKGHGIDLSLQQELEQDRIIKRAPQQQFEAQVVHRPTVTQENAERIVQENKPLSAKLQYTQNPVVMKYLKHEQSDLQQLKGDKDDLKDRKTIHGNKYELDEVLADYIEKVTPDQFRKDQEMIRSLDKEKYTERQQQYGKLMQEGYRDNYNDYQFDVHQAPQQVKQQEVTRPLTLDTKQNSQSQEQVNEQISNTQKNQPEKPFSTQTIQNENKAIGSAISPPIPKEAENVTINITNTDKGEGFSVTATGKGKVQQEENFLKQANEEIVTKTVEPHTPDQDINKNKNFGIINGKPYPLPNSPQKEWEEKNKNKQAQQQTNSPVAPQEEPKAATLTPPPIPQQDQQQNQAKSVPLPPPPPPPFTEQQKISTVKPQLDQQNQNLDKDALKTQTKAQPPESERGALMNDIRKGVQLKSTTDRNMADKPAQETFEINAKVNSREIADRIRAVLEREQVNFSIKGSIAPAPAINVSTSKGKNDERSV